MRGPRPAWVGSTMKLAVATCEPRPARFEPILAEPRMAALGGHHGATRSLLYPTGRAASSEKLSG